ncbi:hypothetical protein D3C78_1702720 [compost metagenome]
MLGHWPASIAAGAKQHGAPEVGNGRKVMRPGFRRDDAVDHRADHRIAAGIVIEAINHRADHGLVETLGRFPADALVAGADGRTGIVVAHASTSRIE